MPRITRPSPLKLTLQAAILDDRRPEPGADPSLAAQGLAALARLDKERAALLARVAAELRVSPAPPKPATKIQGPGDFVKFGVNVAGSSWTATRAFRLHRPESGPGYVQIGQPGNAHAVSAFTGHVPIDPEVIPGLYVATILTDLKAGALGVDARAITHIASAVLTPVDGVILFAFSLPPKAKGIDGVIDVWVSLTEERLATIHAGELIKVQ